MIQEQEVIEGLKEYFSRNEIDQDHLEYVLAVIETLKNITSYKTIQEIKKKITAKGLDYDSIIIPKSRIIQ